MAVEDSARMHQLNVPTLQARLREQGADVGDRTVEPTGVA